jgi:spore germination protein YaaH
MLPILITSISEPLPQYAAVPESPEPPVPELEKEEPIILLPEGEELPVSSFGEIWGYLISGREHFFKPEMPISDIGYFGAEVNIYGQLVGVPNPKNIPNFSGRIHLVVACNGQALSHFVLMEGTQVRQKLIADLLEASKQFEGLQIDFENVPARDGAPYRSFLGELRQGLGTKTFTVALSARSRTLENDVYDYGKISGIVDRILVMAYDEHWSGSKPGPIASMDWCRSVANYALKIIGPEKLIMGLPFYGRSWGNWNPSQAYIYSTIQQIKDEQQITYIRREKGIPTFTYKAPITATVYYEDDYSISNRMELYRGLGVKAVGFWRIGQESPTVWKQLALSP